MNEQNLIEQARKDAEEMASCVRELYEELFNSDHEATVPPAVMLFFEGGIRVLLDPSISSRVFASRENRHEFLQDIANNVGRSGLTHAVVVCESVMYLVPEESRRRFAAQLRQADLVHGAGVDEESESNSERKPFAVEAAIANGATEHDAILVSLYLPGPIVAVGRILVKDGTASAFEWIERSSLAGGFVPNYEQRAN